MKKILYILELTGGNYYIGQTEKIDKMLQRHKKGKGASWTKKNAPIRIIETKDITNLEENSAEKLINNLVIEYMRKYGWEKVRGGYFTQSDDNSIKKQLIAHKMLSHNGKVRIDRDIFSENNKNDKYLYCLELINNRYYVGISYDPEKRFYEHLKGKKESALYTRKYSPKKIMFTQNLGDTDESVYLKMETQATINLMKLVGCYKVRGGDFLHVDDKQEFILFRNTILKNKSNYVFPIAWHNYTINDFMKDINYIPKSVKEILF